jgi:hypothetical protein
MRPPKAGRLPLRPVQEHRRGVQPGEEQGAENQPAQEAGQQRRARARGLPGAVLGQKVGKVGSHGRSPKESAGLAPTLLFRCYHFSEPGHKPRSSAAVSSRPLGPGRSGRREKERME